MALLSVSRQGLQQIIAIDNVGVVKVTEFFVANYDSDIDGSAVLGAVDPTTADANHTMPGRGSAHPTMAGIKCKTYEMRPNGNDTRRSYVMRAEYDDDSATVSSPLDRPAEIEWDFGENGQVPYFLDHNPGGAKPVVNTTGELFSDYLQRIEGYVTCNWSKNYAPSAVDPTTYVSDSQTINNDTFTIDGRTVTAYQGRLAGAKISKVQKENGVSYRTVSMILKFQRDWRQVVDSRGYNSKITFGGVTTLKQITIAHPPVAPCRPWPLQTDGSPCANITDTPATLTFYPYTLIAFSGLGLS